MLTIGSWQSLNTQWSSWVDGLNPTEAQKASIQTGSLSIIYSIWWLVSVVNATRYRITWERGLKHACGESSWLHWGGKPAHCGWHPFSGLDPGLCKQERGTEQHNWLIALCFWTMDACEQLSQEPAFLTFLDHTPAWETMNCPLLYLHLSEYFLKRAGKEAKAHHHTMPLALREGRCQANWVKLVGTFYSMSTNLDSASTQTPSGVASCIIL